MCSRWNVLLVNFKESAPPCENDCICPFSSACFGRKWHEMLGNTIKKCGALAGRAGGGGARKRAEADVQQRTSHTFETFHLIPVSAKN